MNDDNEDRIYTIDTLDFSIDEDDPEFFEKIKKIVLEEIGMTEDEVEIVFPQYTDSKPLNSEVYIPVDSWSMIPMLSENTLREIGCVTFAPENINDKKLMLFPANWYPYIPEGMELTNIFFKDIKFKKGQSSKEQCEGLLSYGVLLEGN